jgi:hypothetical protein
MKKIIVLILSVSMVTASAFTAYAADFSDVKQGNWAYEAVSAMSAKAVLSGYPDGSFKPGNTVTYGEFIKMALIAATGEDEGNSTSGNWAENYYSKAKELDYYTEYDINENSLSRQITRAHMALIISSILGDVKIDQYDEIQKGITDITFKTAYEYDITKAYATGILTGYTDQTFKPEKTLSRAEAATVIYRLVDESKRVVPGTASETEIPKAVNQKNIDEMITNLRSFYGSTGGFDDDLAEAETYEINENYEKYGITLHENNGTRWIQFPAEMVTEIGRLYFIKGNEVIDLLRMGYGSGRVVTAGYDSDIDITTVDYIASLDIYDHITFIVNPFKQ